MKLGRVVGTVVSTIKSSGLNSYKLMLVSHLDLAADSIPSDEHEAFVAIDLVGAGEGEIVLISRGSAARVSAGASDVPTDAAIVAVVDNVQIGERNAYSKG
jgi:microcompartment protein CcmK/EutM